MNNPFHYSPSERMLGEQTRLMERIECLCREDATFAQEVAKGKMFGILIAHDNGNPAHQTVLTAYSGQICGQFGIHGFVPAVFDYLAPDGYFKVHEREITALNDSIAEKLSSQELQALRESLISLRRSADVDITAFRETVKEAKAQRDRLRSEGNVSEEQLIGESQFLKAELHRKRQQWKQRVDMVQSELDSREAEIRKMKLQRQRMSDSLQQWLFRQMVFTDCHGNRQTLLKIWRRYSSAQEFPSRLPSLPPSGSGECCEPKLINYAHTHGLVPEEIGMFWWGQSPKGEVRRHGEFYPACNGKCRPVLQFLLGDDTLFHDTDTAPGELKIVYEDQSVIVVDKPAGMLSVPGKDGRESVCSLLRERGDGGQELLMVHRLDMDTSGLLVVAKTAAVHKCLQRQFATHVTEKTYTALLEREVSGEGVIELRLCPDTADRPRQKVDDDNGKETVTRYRSLGGNRIELTPLTGRTHQLRVHCAHHRGLDNPIKGDRLYGRPGDRLCLHATVLSFVHPDTGERMTFRSLPDF